MKGRAKIGIVYGLHGGDGVIRYIGSTTDPRTKLLEHRASARRATNNRLHRWIDNAGPENIGMLLLRTVPASTLDQAEQHIIGQALGAGLSLLNNDKPLTPPRLAITAHLVTDEQTDFIDRITAEMKVPTRQPHSAKARARMTHVWHVRKGIIAKGCEHCAVTQ